MEGVYAAVCPTGGAATEAAAGTSFSFGGGTKEKAGRIGGGGEAKRIGVVRLAESYCEERVCLGATLERG